MPRNSGIFYWKKCKIKNRCQGRVKSPPPRVNCWLSFITRPMATVPQPPLQVIPFFVFKCPLYYLCIMNRKAFQHTPCNHVYTFCLLLILFVILLEDVGKTNIWTNSQIGFAYRPSSWSFHSCCITNIVVWSLRECHARLRTILVVFS